MHKATWDTSVRREFLLNKAKSTSIMVVHNLLEVRVTKEINFGDFTVLLTIIRHQKANYFLFWR